MHDGAIEAEEGEFDEAAKIDVHQSHPSKRAATDACWGSTLDGARSSHWIRDARLTLGREEAQRARLPTYWGSPLALSARSNKVHSGFFGVAILRLAGVNPNSDAIRIMILACRLAIDSFGD